MRTLILLVILSTATIGCSTAYYAAMEKVGVHKREILVDRVEDAREAQVAAQEQFTSALEQFRSVVAFDGGELEEVYERLSDELERSEKRATDVYERVDAVADVAGALFREWESELDMISSASLRAKSEQYIRETRSRYEQMMTAMRRAQDRIEPVLVPFRDQVLFLKHNLNARAIDALAGEVSGIETDVDSLIRDLQIAIAAADEFMRDNTL